MVQHSACIMRNWNWFAFHLLTIFPQSSVGRWKKECLPGHFEVGRNWFFKYSTALFQIDQVLGSQEILYFFLARGIFLGGRLWHHQKYLSSRWPQGSFFYSYMITTKASPFSWPRLLIPCVGRSSSTSYSLVNFMTASLLMECFLMEMWNYFHLPLL